MPHPLADQPGIFLKEVLKIQSWGKNSAPALKDYPTVFCNFIFITPALPSALTMEVNIC